MTLPIDIDPQQAFHDVYARLVDLVNATARCPTPRTCA